ncbi:MAG: hypothetical protein RI964_2983 [Pseudomonadota bacterium]|jgi:hypothetical protein
MVGVAILHEGNTKSLDNLVLRKLITELEKENPVIFNCNRVQYYGLKGKSNFFDISNTSYRELLPQIEADQISKVLFVMDADSHENDASYGGYNNTLASWKKFVTDTLKIDKISGLYITCDPTTQTGYVESLLLSTLDNDQKACIETFLNCSDFKAKGHDKAIFNQIYKMAYPDTPDDLQHAHFYELKQKLRALFS